MKSVLFLTRNGLLEPLGQSQIFPYLRALSFEYSVRIVSFEKRRDLLNEIRIRSFSNDLLNSGIFWISLRFYSRPRCLAPAYAIVQLVITALWQSLFLTKPGLVHARSYIPAVVAMFLSRLCDVPFIFDMRALWPEELITAGHLRRGSLLHRVLLWVEERCLGEASAVVSLTHAAVRHLQERYPQQLAGKRIAVIPTCADLKRFQLAALEPAAPIVIGCVGTLLSGWFLLDWLHAFLDAISRLDSTVRFELVSRDSPGAILAALKPKPTWADRLRIDSANPDQMPAILQRHTASVMFFTGGLSKLGSCPTRLAEVLACGRPVVTNPGVGDVEQVIRQHRVGVLACDSSATEMDLCVAHLLELLQDPQLARRCRRTAEQLFSLEAGTEAYRQLYSDILC